MPRKTKVTSVSLDVLTLERLNHLIKSHYSNQLSVSVLVEHAVNDLYAKIEFAESSGFETPVPKTKWG